MRRLTESELIADFEKIGICTGDTILLRASLSSVGRISGGADSFINALQHVVGPHGTIVSLAFTSGDFIKKPNINDAFDIHKKSYAGPLPNTLIKREGAFRSRHPMCSFVAIGRFAKEITENHDEKSPAYEPVRKIIDLDGKCMLIGCVDNSPGFTTAHLVEADLGLSALAIFSKMLRTYYKNENGELRIFRRTDPGLCSNSFYKFYALYVKSKILKVGLIGEAYSILAPARECYEIEYEALANNRKFNLCGSADCFTCNAGRWDRLHCAPGFFLRLLIKKLRKKRDEKTESTLP